MRGTTATLPSRRQWAALALGALLVAAMILMGVPAIIIASIGYVAAFGLLMAARSR